MRSQKTVKVYHFQNIIIIRFTHIYMEMDIWQCDLQSKSVFNNSGHTFIRKWIFGSVIFRVNLCSIIVVYYCICKRSKLRELVKSQKIFCSFFPLEIKQRHEWQNVNKKTAFKTIVIQYVYNMSVCAHVK